MPFATVKGNAFEGEALSGERLKYLRLFDLYGALLTGTQREICEKYYLYDLSLSEIAEEKNITKQAVSDALKTSRELLDHYEKKLHFKAQSRANSRSIADMVARVSAALEEFALRHPEFSAEIGSIADMVCVGEVMPPDEEE